LHGVSVAPPVAAFVVMSEHGRYLGARFAQMNVEYMLSAVYYRIELSKETLWAAVVTDLPASGSTITGKFAAD